MSVLVAGGCGFIGSHLVRKLLEEGEKVVIFDLRPNLALIQDIADKLTIVQGDSTSAVDVFHVIQEHKVSNVFQLIGLLADVSQVKPLLAERVSVGSTLNFLEAARIFGLNRIVYASSSAVYDPKEPAPVSEAAATRPPSVYGATKVMSEFYGMHYHKMFGLDFVALRFTTIYGLGKSGGSTGICSQMIEKAGLGQPVVVDTADAVTDWLYVKDAVRALLLAMRVSEPRQRIYNIGEGSYSTRQVAAVVKRLLPDAQIELVAKRTFPWPPSYDISKAEEELKYKPLFDIEKGVADFIEDCRKLKRAQSAQA
jgi:UDP-glucose 4-epimerase